MAQRTGPSFLESLTAELAQLERAGLRRVLRCTDDDHTDGGPALVLCTNDYLALARDPRLAAAASAAAQREGTGAGSARLVSGTRPAHEALERAVEAWTCAPRALIFSSGFAANLACLGSLLGPEDLAVSDRLNHASLIDGLRLCGATRRVVPHADVASFRDALADAGSFRRAVVVTEGVFSMDGDLAPLGDLLEVARAAGALLYVDDAHGAGLVGPTGRGSLEVHGIGVEPDVAHLGTFGKAFGAAGAFVAAASPVVDLTVQRGRAFVFSTAPAPPVAAAAQEGLRIAAAEPWRRERCRAAAREFAERLAEAGVVVSSPAGAIVPVTLGEAERAVRASGRLLGEHGILVPAIRPPTVPEGTSRLRLTTTAATSPADVERAARAIAEVVR